MTIGDFLDDAAHHFDERCCEGDGCTAVVEACTLKDPDNIGKDLCPSCVDGYFERQAELLDEADSADLAAALSERDGMRQAQAQVSP